MVYAFESADETDLTKAYRSQRVTNPWIQLGQDSIIQARVRFNFAANSAAAQIYPHRVTNDDGELAFHGFMASVRQGFDHPLPYKEFYFRVVAVAAADSEFGDSDLSAYTRTRPGARSLSAAQMGALVEDAKAKGAGGDGFVFIDTGTAAGATTARALYIPFSNSPAPAYDYFFSAWDGRTNSDFLARAAIEIKNHPAYIGAETLIFTT